MQSLVSLHMMEKALTKACVNTLNVMHDDLSKLADSKGAYILSMHLDSPTPIDIPKIKTAVIQSGTYFYVGSAYGRGGIAARLKRHFKKHKKIHWHVDQLTSAAASAEAFAVPNGNECELVETLISSGQFKTAMKGFGNSDCRLCDSHLLMLND